MFYLIFSFLSGILVTLLACQIFTRNRCKGFRSEKYLKFTKIFFSEKSKRQRTEAERDSLLSRVTELENRLEQAQSQSDQWRSKYEKSIVPNDTLHSTIEGLRSNLSVRKFYKNFSRKN